MTNPHESETEQVERLAGVKLTHFVRTPASKDNSAGLGIGFHHPDGRHISIGINNCAGDHTDRDRVSEHIKRFLEN